MRGITGLSSFATRTGWAIKCSKHLVALCSISKLFYLRIIEWGRLMLNHPQERLLAVGLTTEQLREDVEIAKTESGLII